jgi:mono/diheme cytochrome c family protein
VGPLLAAAAIGALGTILGGILVAGPLIVAKRGDLPLERAYGDFAVSVASRFGGANQQNPVAQNGRALVAGRDAYTGSCAVCHGATGDGRGVFGRSSYPNATDLTSHDAAEKSDGQLFWMIKNGLSFTGMPGFADQYSDQEIWSLVAYVRALQNPRSPSIPTGNQGGPPAGPGQPTSNRNGQPPQARGAGDEELGFQFGPIDVPTPTTAQLNHADPRSGDPAARGAAVYFAQGCQLCHGPAGDAPGNLGLVRGGGPEAVRAIRQGRPGMPAYDQAQLNDNELADLQAYLGTIGATQRRGG